MERIVIINESTFTKWMERVKELLSVLHLQEQQMKNKSLGTWLDTSEVCAMLNLSKRSVQSMRERGELPYTKIEGRIYHRADDIVMRLSTAELIDSRMRSILTFVSTVSLLFPSNLPEREFHN